MSPQSGPLVTRRPGFLRLARWYVRSRMKKNFDGVYLEGAPALRRLLQAGPVIFAPTHVAWWDPLFAVRIDEVLGAHSYALMERVNLTRLPFFGWLGAIAIDGENTREALGQLHASVALLDGPGKALWIFPQGEQRPAHLRPLGLKSGVAVLAESGGMPVIPLALNYLYRRTEKPAAFASFGQPIEPRGLSRRALLGALEAGLESALGRIDAFATRAEGDFEELSAPSANAAEPRAAKLLKPFRKEAENSAPSSRQKGAART